MGPINPITNLNSVYHHSPRDNIIFSVQLCNVSDQIPQFSFIALIFVFLFYFCPHVYVPLTVIVLLQKIYIWCSCCDQNCSVVKRNIMPTFFVCQSGSRYLSFAQLLQRRLLLLLPSNRTFLHDYTSRTPLNSILISSILLNVPNSRQFGAGSHQTLRMPEIMALLLLQLRTVLKSCCWVVVNYTQLTAPRDTMATKCPLQNSLSIFPDTYVRVLLGPYRKIYRSRF